MRNLRFSCPAWPGRLAHVRQVLANGSIPSNQPGDCPAQSTMKTPKANPQSLPRQRDLLGDPARTLAALGPKPLSVELNMAVF
jgi:hypothetical protein